MEQTIQYPYHQVVYKLPKVITAKTLAQNLFIEERTMCFVTGYYLRPYVNSPFRLIDCTMGGENSHKKFLDSSIPTSCFLDTSNVLCDKSSPLPNCYPTKDQVISAMDNLGVTTSDTIILYCQDHMDSSMTRVFHILTSYGFNDVSILDGGLFKFKQEGYPTVPGVDYTGPASDIKELADPSPYLIQMDEIVEFAKGNRPNMILIDARGPDSFNGHDPSLPPGCRQGHVPGAINISADLFINEDDTFKKYTELVQIFEQHKIDPSKDIVCMCKTGVSATVAYVALVMVGYSGMRLYDGSWTEYGSNDTPSAVIAPKFPMYMQPTPFVTPQYVLVPAEHYMLLQNNKDHYPVYKP